MEESKIKGIPNTEEIKLESIPDQWKLFSRGMLSQFQTNGVIVVDKVAQRKVRITITMKLIASPDQYTTHTETFVKKTQGLDLDKSASIVRIDQFFMDQIDKRIWLLIGYIPGKVNVPILIHYYEKFDYAVYSVIKETEEITKYFPKGIPNVNPQSN